MRKGLQLTFARSLTCICIALCWPAMAAACVTPSIEYQYPGESKAEYKSRLADYIKLGPQGAYRRLLQDNLDNHTVVALVRAGPIGTKHPHTAHPHFVAYRRSFELIRQLRGGGVRRKFTLYDLTPEFASGCGRAHGELIFSKPGTMLILYSYGARSADGGIANWSVLTRSSDSTIAGQLKAIRDPKLRAPGQSGKTAN